MTLKPNPSRKVGKPKTGTSENSITIPMRYGDDPYVWACWLYYEDGLTQSEIADVMGISRATVNSYLAEARDKGIVSISLEGGRLESLSVAQELKRHFGLTDCLIIPHDDNARPLIDRLGVAGAHALNKILKSGDTLAVARDGRCFRSASKLPSALCRT